MALPYALLPITAVALGLLAAGSARTLFWLPAALEAAFALLFPLAGERMIRLALLMVALLVLAFTLLLSPAFTWLERAWGTGPAAGMVFAPAVGALLVAMVLERIKRENDLVTYREILAFMNGETDIERDPRALPRRGWPTKHRLAYDLLAFLAAAIIGGVIGFATWGLLN